MYFAEVLHVIVDEASYSIFWWDGQIMVLLPACASIHDSLFDLMQSQWWNYTLGAPQHSCGLHRSWWVDIVHKMEVYELSSNQMGWTVSSMVLTGLRWNWGPYRNWHIVSWLLKRQCACMMVCYRASYKGASVNKKIWSLYRIELLPFSFCFQSS